MSSRDAARANERDVTAFIFHHGLDKGNVSRPPVGWNLTEMRYQLASCVQSAVFKRIGCSVIREVALYLDRRWEFRCVAFRKGDSTCERDLRQRSQQKRGLRTCLLFGQRRQAKERECEGHPAIFPVWEVRAVVGPGKPKRILRVVRWCDGYIAYGTGEPHAAGDLLYELLPLRPRGSNESLTLNELRISSRFEAGLAVKRALFVYGCLHVEFLHAAKNRISRYFEQTCLTFVWNDQSEFAPNLRGKKSERGNLRGRIEIKERIALWNGRDHMVEEIWGRKGRVGLKRGTHQSGISLDSDGLQKRREKSVLVLAISVLIGKHLGGRVGNIPARAQRNTDITKTSGHKIVNCLKFFGVARLTAGVFLSFCADFRRDFQLRLLQGREPFSDVVPRTERSQLNIGRFGGAQCFLPIRLLVGWIVFKVRPVEGVDATSAIVLRNGRKRRTAQKRRDLFRDVDFDLFILNDSLVLKIVREPEVALGNGMNNGPANVVLDG